MTFRSNIPDVNDPTRQCTCGFRRFRAQAVRDVEEVERWVLFDDGAFGGMGSIPFGLPFGSGSGGVWGEFTGTKRVFSEQITCENCSRVRSTDVKSSFTLFGSFVQNGQFCVIAADITPTGLGCLSLEFDGPGSVPSVPLTASYPVLPLALPSPSETAGLPQGPAASMLCAALPTVVVEGEYIVTFVDRCNGYTQQLATVLLENDVIILNPKDADLNGAPDIWISRNWKAAGETVQVASGSQQAVPFDKCDEVIEYDARAGTLPTAQGFSEIGTAPTAVLLPGGVAQISTLGGGDAYYRQDVVLDDPADEVYMYARYQHRSNVAADGNGDGFNVLAAVAAGSSAPYRGTRFKNYLIPETVTLDGTADSIASAQGKGLGAWRAVALDAHISADLFLFMHNDFAIESSIAAIFGTIAGPAGVDPVLRLEFGDLNGVGNTTLVRNVVASVGGRFTRAGFNAYAMLANPVVRLSLYADTQVGTGRTMRFLVKYGALGVGSNPYTAPATSTSLTVDFLTANTIFEPSFQMLGIPAETPFWFTVERDHTHADDLNGATAWLRSATVRAQ